VVAAREESIPAAEKRLDNLRKAAATVPPKKSFTGKPRPN